MKYAYVEVDPSLVEYLRENYAALLEHLYLAIAQAEIDGNADELLRQRAVQPAFGLSPERALEERDSQRAASLRYDWLVTLNQLRDVTELAQNLAVALGDVIGSVARHNASVSVPVARYFNFEAGGAKEVTRDAYRGDDDELFPL